MEAKIKPLKQEIDLECYTVAMLHLFHFGGHQGPPPGLGNGLLFNGMLCVFFALAILAAPELLAYFVAVILLVIGTSMLTTWWKLRK